jgi:hypothetical protein
MCIYSSSYLATPDGYLFVSLVSNFYIFIVLLRYPNRDRDGILAETESHLWSLFFTARCLRSKIPNLEGAREPTKQGRQGVGWYGKWRRISHIKTVGGRRSFFPKLITPY